MDKRNVGGPRFPQEMFDGQRGFRVRVADPDSVSVSLRILFQQIKPGKYGRFIAGGINEDVPAVGRQVQFFGSIERLGIVGGPAINEEEPVIF